MPVRDKTVTYFKYQRDIAKHFNVREYVVSDWKRSKDFPDKFPNRGWRLQDIDAWLRKHSKGPYSNRDSEEAALAAGRAEQESLLKARIAKTFEEAENHRIRKERALVAQQIELGNIVFTEDVDNFHRRVAGTVMTTVDGLPDVLDREMPEELPDEETWKLLRSRIMELSRRLVLNVSNAVQDLHRDKNGNGDAKKD